MLLPRQQEVVLGDPISAMVRGWVSVSKGILEDSARVRRCEPSASYWLKPLADVYEPRSLGGGPGSCGRLYFSCAALSASFAVWRPYARYAVGRSLSRDRKATGGFLVRRTKGVSEDHDPSRCRERDQQDK